MAKVELEFQWRRDIQQNSTRHNDKMYYGTRHNVT
jgi:hypothetical protein